MPRFNPVLTVAMQILADAQATMGNALSMAWDATKSPESYGSRGAAWQATCAPTQTPFNRSERLQLLELAPTVSRLYHDLLQIRFQEALGTAPNDAARKTAAPCEWTLEGGQRLGADTEATRRVRTGRVVSLIQASCHAELDVLVGLQIECLRVFKAPANPFSADNFGGAMVAAVEAALPDAQQQQAFLVMLPPNFAIALRSALRQYAKSFARDARTISQVPQQDRRRTDAPVDQQFLPTEPAQFS